MAHFMPWSKQVQDECLRIHQNGGIPVIDLDFTSQCTSANCIYCDSKPAVGRKSLNEVTFEEIEKILEEGSENGLKWVYSCGLGEPLEDTKFVKTVEKAHSLGISFSIFTNGLLIDSREKAQWLYDNDVSIILKLDTFNEENFDKILQIKGGAKRVYKALEYLLDVGYGELLENDGTRLALSIVPTSININDIEDVFKFAIAHNIFPSIGELELAGLTLIDESYKDLDVSFMLKEQKKRLDELWGGSYCRPLCPCILTGVHINHIGNCIVDVEAGLNCKWFMLQESPMREIGSIRDENLLTLDSRVRKNKIDLFEQNSSKINEYGRVDHIYGGCGGSPKNIINLAKQQVEFFKKKSL